MRAHGAESIYYQDKKTKGTVGQLGRGHSDNKHNQKESLL